MSPTNALSVLAERYAASEDLPRLSAVLSALAHARGGLARWRASVATERAPVIDRRLANLRLDLPGLVVSGDRIWIDGEDCTPTPTRAWVVLGQDRIGRGEPCLVCMAPVYLREEAFSLRAAVPYSVARVVAHAGCVVGLQIAVEGDYGMAPSKDA